ncbi:MAG: lysyl-tRNA synthetase class 2, partial [Glaciecola sp.]
MSDHQQDENRLIAERRGKLAQIRENCPSNGFPNQFDRKHYAQDLQTTFGDKDKETLVEEANIFSIAGRIMAKR